MKPFSHQNKIVSANQNWLYRLIFAANIRLNHLIKSRLLFICLAFFLLLGAASVRLLQYGVTADENANTHIKNTGLTNQPRPVLLDRNGVPLAIDVEAYSLFAEPRNLLDVDEAVDKLTAVLPGLDYDELRERLDNNRGFAWVKRELTDTEFEAVTNLGLPGLGFRREKKRFYPNGALTAHLVGHVNIDHQGIAGLEKWVDDTVQNAGNSSRQNDAITPVTLAVDIHVQHAMREELAHAKAKFDAIAAAGLIADVNNGEILAMVSLPDYDPLNPETSLNKNVLNRLTTGVYEMGSTFKALTMAMALDSGKVHLHSRFDARKPLRYGRFTINDYRGQKRIMDVGDIFIHSSNIGTAKIALEIGKEDHQNFLRKLGLLDRLKTELPESAAPLLPPVWKDINTVTISFGHGLSVAPLQAVMATSALVNGGRLVAPTFIKTGHDAKHKIGKQVISPQTSQKLRYLMRHNAEKGSARKANVEGYYLGGKTGTSEKVINGKYDKDKRLTSLMGVFPADKPQYLMLVMLDEPKALPETHGFATSGWNAVPTAGKILERVAPLLDVHPRFALPPAKEHILNQSGLRTAYQN